MRQIALLLAFCIGPNLAIGGKFSATVEGPGVYFLTFEQCAEQFNGEKLGKITIAQRDIACPVWLDDQNADNQFGEGDRLLFLSPTKQDRSVGFETPYPPVIINNDPDLPTELETVATLSPSDAKGNTSAAPPFELLHHIEEDNIRTSIRGSDFNSADRFFWQRFTSLDEAPLEVNLLDDVPNLILDNENSPRVLLSLVGITTLPGDSEKVAEHALTFTPTGFETIARQWSGTEEHIIEITDLSHEELGQPVTMKLAERYDDDGNFIADIALLNWIEIRAPIAEIPEEFSDQAQISTSEGTTSNQYSLSTKCPNLALYQSTGEAWALSEPGTYHVAANSEATASFLVLTGTEKPVTRVSRFRTPDLSFISRGDVDYLALAPEKFAEGITPLLSAHEEQGIRTHLLSIEDCYDAFGNGFPSPRAIHEAIRQWFGDRKSTDKPAYVLLAGDASSDPPGQNRNLIPTWTFTIRESLCASDNPYACVEGDDYIPDLAIGRLPVASTEELDRVVAKTVDMLAADKVKPKSEMHGLWIADHNKANWQRALQASKRLRDFNIDGEVIYAQDDETHADRIVRIKKALYEAPDFTVYFGHGARHNWQTGGHDYAEQSSLFTTDQLQEWPEGEDTNPIRTIISITCDSAPYDHPTDDSLGERFVTMAHGGAVTFIGASWRIDFNGSLPFRFASAIEQSRTVGEAFLTTKSKIEHRPYLESFNLLGDPAVPLKRESLSPDSSEN
ncbi:MAG: hypothetical protein CMO55_07030 [Verrucomicrobiales bacterium]|nr:hypothetical protein [Verrucomicrobiales bacterium]